MNRPMIIDFYSKPVTPVLGELYELVVPDAYFTSIWGYGTGEVGILVDANEECCTFAIFNRTIQAPQFARVYRSDVKSRLHIPEYHVPEYYIACPLPQVPQSTTSNAVSIATETRTENEK